MKTRKDYWYVWLGLAALALLFTGGKFSVAAAAWIGNIFFIRFMRDGKVGARYFIVVAVTWVVSMISWYGIQPMTGVAYAITMLVTVLISSLPLLADRVLHRHLPGWMGTLVFPAVATAVEFGMVSSNPMGSFGALAYTQFGVLPLLQFVSVGGLTGLAFLISWFPSVVNHVWERGWKSSRLLMAVAASIYAAVFVFGFVHLADTNNELVQVSMIVRGDGEANLRTVLSGEAVQQDAEALLSGLEAETVRERAAGSRIIAWPEGAVVTSESEMSSVRARLGVLSRRLDIYLVAPYIAMTAESYENGLDIYAPSGEVVLNHIKFGGNVFEGSVPGDGVLKYVDTEYGRISAAVCWDMDFPAAIQQAGRDSVDIMISPSAEWREIVPTHAQMAAFRGVENGMNTIHPATVGLSVAADTRGRVLGELNWFTSDDAVLRVDVPTTGVQTVYATVGEVFGPASGALALLLSFHGAVTALLARRKVRVKKVETTETTETTNRAEAHA